MLKSLICRSGLQGRVIKQGDVQHFFLSSLFCWLTLYKICRWWSYNIFVVMWVWIKDISIFFWTCGSFFIIFVNTLKTIAISVPTLTIHLAQRRAAARLCPCAYSNRWSVITGQLHGKFTIARINALLSEPSGGEAQRAGSHLLVQYKGRCTSTLCSPAVASQHGLGSNGTGRRKTLSDKDSLLAFCTGMKVS